MAEWATSIALTVLALVVMMGAVAILLVVVLWPRAPYVAVRGASLDVLLYESHYDPDKGYRRNLTVLEVALLLEAHNDADHSAVTFSQLEIRLMFANVTVAVVRADPFRVRA